MSNPSNETKEFAAFWFDECRFCSIGKPEDAASYLEAVLRAVAFPSKDPDHYIRVIGGVDGLREFIFQWLRASGLIENLDGAACLSAKGHRVLALLEAGCHYPLFDLD